MKDIHPTFLRLFLTLLLSIYVIGCSDQVRLPSAEQLAEFENASPVRPTVDLDQLVRAKIDGGPYRVVPDDVLELNMPAVLQTVTVEGPGGTERIYPYICRVGESGTIRFPIVGEIEAAERSLGEIESAVIDAYYPNCVVTLPSVFARVLEYKTAKVSIIGAVEKPGVYELRSDQMSLVALLMEAGGIVDEGAAFIRIIRADEISSGDENTSSNAKLNASDSKQDATSDEVSARQRPGIFEEQDATSDEVSAKQRPEILEWALGKRPEVAKKVESGRLQKLESIVLPVRGLNIPFADAALQDGDTVIVERLRVPLFSVIGLVKKPGNFPYPPDIQYNLMQALAFAGGLDLAAEPRYATVYRLKSDGTIVNMPLKIVEGTRLTAASNTPLKAGDIIDVAHTPRTRTNLFLQRIFSVHVGAYVPIWDDD